MPHLHSRPRRPSHIVWWGEYGPDEAVRGLFERRPFRRLVGRGPPDPVLIAGAEMWWQIGGGVLVFVLLRWRRFGGVFGGGLEVSHDKLAEGGDFQA